MQENNISNFSILKMAWDLFQGSERRGALHILAIIALMATSEFASIALIYPYVALLSGSGEIAQHDVVILTIEALGITSRDGVLLLFAAVAAASVMVSAAVRLFGQWKLIRFVQMRRHSIGIRLLGNYMQQPYSFFLERDISGLKKTILAEVDQVVYTVYTPIASALAAAATLLSLSFLMIFVNPLVTACAVGVFSVLYLGIFLTLKSKLNSIGQRMLLTNAGRFRTLSDALDGAKAIRLAGREKQFIEAFDAYSDEASRIISVSQTISQLPRYVIETIAIAGIVLLSGTLIGLGEIDGENAPDTLATFGVFLVAAYRMLPAVQILYNAGSQIQFGAPALAHLHHEMALKGVNHIDVLNVKPLSLEIELQLNSVSHHYEGSKQPALKEISLTIERRESVGIIGPSGSGKSTLVDILLGLLEPTSGEFLVDGLLISDDVRQNWHATVGYVPQDIYLFSGSILDNIALTKIGENIDRPRAQRCAAMASIAEFVESELPDQYDTLIGEGGMRLSGGQRQRIAIARALYNNPSVLILDEATSALDGLTEDQVIEEIDILTQTKTVIIIAHRLATIRKMDRVIVLRDGEVAFTGSASEVIAQDGWVRDFLMAGAGHPNNSNASFGMKQLQKGENETS
jgi:ABC-type multidrug transport system fused ATPase/permease subunit